MTESVQSTYEEATRCPKCSLPGEVKIKRPAPADAHLPRGTEIHTVYCKTTLCPWYNTCWIVQVNPDGSVPPPKNHTREPKVYSGIEGHDELAAQLIAGIKAERERSQLPRDDPRHEVRGR